MITLSRSLRAFALCVTASAFGCSDPTQPSDTTLLIRTDKIAYSLVSDQAARAVLLNLGPQIVYAPMNEYVYVERLVSGRWQHRRAWFAVDGTGVSFPVPPGDSLVARPMRFAYVDHRPGVYRFVFEVAFDALGRRLVPESQRVSPRFELRP